MKLEFHPGLTSTATAFVIYDSYGPEIRIAPNPDGGWTAIHKEMGRDAATAEGDTPNTALTNLVVKLPWETRKKVNRFSGHITMTPVGESVGPAVASTTTIRFDLKGNDSIFAITLDRFGSSHAVDVLVQPADDDMWRAKSVLVPPFNQFIRLPDGSTNPPKDGVLAECVGDNISAVLNGTDALAHACIYTMVIFTG